jgi:hypothetical protein
MKGKGFGTAKFFRTKYHSSARSYTCLHPFHAALLRFLVALASVL